MTSPDQPDWAKAAAAELRSAVIWQSNTANAQIAQALVEAELRGTTHLIAIIADIREKSGVGAKPMLDELADAIAAEIATQARRVPGDAVDDFLAEVRAEIIRARVKFPGDNLTTIALMEEVGEVAKAVLDESPERVRKEAVQVACMAARLVLDGDSSTTAYRAQRSGQPPLVATKGGA